MDDLATWLRAQLDADAAEIAKHPDGEDDWIDDGGHSGLEATEEGNYPCAPYLRISKKRVLAEVDAKRRLLDGHEQEIHRCEGGDFAVDSQCRIQRLLAIPYADRPGYREEWRP